MVIGSKEHSDTSHILMNRIATNQATGPGFIKRCFNRLFRGHLRDMAQAAKSPPRWESGAAVTA